VVRAGVSAATRHRYLEVLIVPADGTGAAAEKKELRHVPSEQLSNNTTARQRRRPDAEIVAGEVSWGSLRLARLGQSIFNPSASTTQVGDPG